MQRHSFSHIAVQHSLRLVPWFLTVVLAALFSLDAQAGSLWTRPGSSERGLCADRKAGAVGDIITVLISESANQTSQQEKKTSNDSAVSASVTQWLFPTSASKGGTHNGSLPATSFGSKGSFDGSGSVTNSQSITATAAVLVTEVLPNGNFVIEGVRRVTYSGETQYIVLHGIVRPDDISSTNTVPSSSIAAARLEFISEGDLSDASKKGWINKLYDTLRPF